MNDDSSKRPATWFRVALDIYRSAFANHHIEDFKRVSSLQPYEVGMSLSYRLDVLSELLRCGYINLHDGFLTIPSYTDTGWLLESLIDGLDEAWKIFELFETKGLHTPKIFDSDVMKQIGDDGERYLIAELKNRLPEDVHDDIVHVALTDDTAGFDIYSRSIIDIDRFMKLEVKASVKPIESGFTFFLSRNEYELSQKCGNWVLVGIHFHSRKPQLLGYLRGHQLSPLVPLETNPSCKWQSLRFTVSTEKFAPGLP